MTDSEEYERLRAENKILIERIAQTELTSRQIERQWKAQCYVNRITEQQLSVANQRLFDLGYIRTPDGMAYNYDYGSLKGIDGIEQ